MGENTSLPFVPGYSFSDRTKANCALSQTLEYNKGCPLSNIIIPDTSKHALDLYKSENHLYDDTMSELTYGLRRTFLKKTPVPDFVSFDKQVLCLYGYFCEEIDDSWSESFRIHHVKVLYYLNDDMMEIYEPKVPNSGLIQGLILKKQKFPRPDGKGMYLWKDLNIGIDLIIYGKKIRLTDCDSWTKEYLESSGVVLNPKIEDIPEDPYTKKQREREMKPAYISPKLEDEKLWKFLNRDRQVLRFFGLWDDTLNDPKDKRKVIILYYLVDDTMEVQEVHRKNDGRDPYGVLIKRQKLPFDLKSLPETFPSSCLEYSDKEIKDWFTPEKLEIGKTVVIFQRKIFIYDCDEFTRHFYRSNFGKEMPPAIDVDEKPKAPPLKAIPPHTGIGTWEDSLQSCIYNVPKPPKKDILKMLHNDNKILRYSAQMDTVSPIDSSRKFIITFFPGDDTLKIHEPPIPNSGIASGCFLKRCRLEKPYKAPDNRPIYYTASDFYIGANIYASGRKFIINDADKYVLSFMEENRKFFTDETIEVHRSKAAVSKLSKEPLSSKKKALEEEMRQHIVHNFGKEPISLSLDLGEDECPLDTIKEKLFAANIPLPQKLLEKAMKICTVENGTVDAGELQKILHHIFRRTEKN